MRSVLEYSRSQLLTSGAGGPVLPYCEYSSPDCPPACSALEIPSAGPAAAAAADGSLPLDLTRRATATARRVSVTDAWRRVASKTAAKRIEQRLANFVATPEKIERRQWQRRTR